MLFSGLQSFASITASPRRALFRYNVDEMLWALNSGLYQAACGNISFVIPFPLKFQELSTMVSGDLRILLFRLWGQWKPALERKLLLFEEILTVSSCVLTATFLSYFPFDSSLPPMIHASNQVLPGNTRYCCCPSSCPLTFLSQIVT